LLLNGWSSRVMSETNCSEAAATRTNRNGWGGRKRFTVFALFALAIGLVVWIEVSTWRQLERVKAEFAGADLDGFYLGLHLRETVLRLNGAALRYQLSEVEGEREQFRQEARELADRIGRAKARLSTGAERQLVVEIQRAYDAYQTGMASLLERGVRGVRRDTASQVHEQISAKSAPLLALAGQLVEAQRRALDRLFASSGAVLGSLQWLLLISVVLLLILFTASAGLLYRALVAPLRVRLSQSQAVIERQEKLASLGVLAAGVAHEVRNPLTAIKFRLFSLKNALPDEFAEHEDVVVINNEINRLERIVRDFLQFARPAEPELAPVAVEPLLQEVHRLLRPELEQRAIEFKIDAGDGAVINADRQQLQQALINLTQNAADSIGRDGIITLRARQGAASVTKEAQPVVMLEVSDTGKGIPPAVEKRIFDPFFSTKEGGTGLGLAIAARIVEKHGGDIQYSTQLNRGTTFRLVLPKVPAQPHEGANSPDRR
jgi:signal transduction histidine kinase